MTKILTYTAIIQEAFEKKGFMGYDEYREFNDVLWEITKDRGLNQSKAFLYFILKHVYSKSERGERPPQLSAKVLNLFLVAWDRSSEKNAWKRNTPEAQPPEWLLKKLEGCYVKFTFPHKPSHSLESPDCIEKHSESSSERTQEQELQEPVDSSASYPG